LDITSFPLGLTIARLFFAAALTVFIAGSLASFGGLGDATTSTKHSLVAVKTALTRSRPAYDLDSPAAHQYTPAKAMICHNGHTIVINRSALPAHLANGDTSGSCSKVAGVHAARRRGAALPASTTTGDALASTGLSLGATALTSLLLMTTGLALRRRTKPQQADS
jgi:hypothetical protein